MTGGVLAENLSAPQASSLRLDSFDAPSGLRNALVSMRVGGIRRIMLPAGLQAGPLPGIGSTTAAVLESACSYSPAHTKPAIRSEQTQ
jgi:hypothetical protein